MIKKENKKEYAKEKEKDNKEIFSIILGFIINIILVIIKLIGGIIAKSDALIADGLHSFSDFITDIVAYFGIKISNIPPDKNHPYGHYKIEDIAVLFMSIILVIVALGICYTGIKDIYHNNLKPSSIITIICALISIFLKEFIFQYTSKIAKETQSQVLYLNAWHHRTDALSSISVLIGSLLGFISPTLYILDPLIAIGIGILIGWIGVKSLNNILKKLIDTSPPYYLYKKIENIISSVEEVKGSHKLKLRHFGKYILVDVHIQVNENLSIKEAHEISGKVKYKIKNNLKNIKDVLIHIEPYSSQKK